MTEKMNCHNEPDTKASFWVRDVPVYGDVILAPMAGFSDIPHRALCRSFGSAMAYTEFVAVEDILARSRKATGRLAFTDEDRPVVLQIFGNDAQKILEAALTIEELEPDVIDVNMGCSTRRVSGRGAGVGMMPRPDLIAKTFQLLSRHLSVPVTGKIRLGWDDHQNYLEVARILEDNGASLVAIHPRTKEQQYRGVARWDAIGELRNALSIPVIGNGDVWQPADIDRMLAHTGCDAVMIGRGAIGNPWLFGRIMKLELLFSQVIATISEHVHTMLAYYGDPYGMIRFRKHLKHYLEKMPDLKPICMQMVSTDDSEVFFDLLAQAKLKFGRQKIASLTHD